jgi:hypothetical protein
MAEARTTFPSEQKKGMVSALSSKSLDNLISLLPTNARIFVDSVLRGEKSSITEEDFTVDELAAIRDVVLESSRPNKSRHTWRSPSLRGTVQYEDYNRLGEFKYGMANVLSSLGRIKTTLGRFGYKQLPDGDVEIGDKYDFSKKPRWGEFPLWEKTFHTLISLGYAPLRYYAGETLPEGKGRQVKIVIPREQFSDAEYATLFSDNYDYEIEKGHYQGGKRYVAVPIK